MPVAHLRKPGSGSLAAAAIEKQGVPVAATAEQGRAAAVDVPRSVLQSPKEETNVVDDVKPAPFSNYVLFIK